MSINIPKCAESNFKKLSEWMLVSLTFLKKVIWEKSYFLESSKVWGLLIYKLIIIFIKMCNLFALENLKIKKKMLKIAKSKKL